MRALSRQVAFAGAADVAAVAVFVVIGRRSHDEGSAIGGVVAVAGPFLIALAGGWLAARVWRAPATLLTGVVVWAVTVAGGLVLRRTVFDRGTAVAFVIVTTLVLAVLMLGWRALVTLRVARRPPAPRQLLPDPSAHS